MEPIIILVTMCFATLASASAFDILYREIPDAHWWTIGALGIIRNLIELKEMTGILMLFGSFLLFLDVMCDLGSKGVRMVPYRIFTALLIAVGFFLIRDQPTSAMMVSIPAMMLIFLAMYKLGILEGGGDAKCLISMSMLFPMYPVIDPAIAVPEGSPLMYAFPLSVLLMASVFTLTSAVPQAVSNIVTGECKSLRTLTMVRMDIERARSSHVWPRQDIVNGEPAIVKNADPKAYDRMESNEFSKIWVSPMIPFIVPISVAFVFLIIVGNPLFLIV